MMGWLESFASIDALEDAPLDAALIGECERAQAAVVGRPIRFSTPTFKAYSSCELNGCGKNAFVVGPDDAPNVKEHHHSVRATDSDRI